MTIQELYTTLYEEMTEGEVSPYAEVITADGQPVSFIETIKEDIYLSSNFSKLFGESQLKFHKDDQPILVTKAGTVMLS